MAKVELGGVVFDPGPRREIGLGGVQALAKLDIPGAGPTYHDMGSDEDPISWDGVFDGNNAVVTATIIDGFRRSGELLDLRTGISPLPVYQVKIREFRYKVLRQDRVEYSITLVRDSAVPDFAPPVETEVAAVTAPASATHTVVSGDTLYAISQQYLGDGSLWPALAASNGITDPSALQVGTVLKVPRAAEAAALVAQYTARTEARNVKLRALRTSTGGWATAE